MRSLRLAVLTALLIAALPAAAQAAPIIDYPDFSNVSGLDLNGDAARVGDVLRVAPADDPDSEQGTAGSAFHVDPIEINRDFLAHAVLRMTTEASETPADGMTFLLQNDPNGSGALGSGGSDLGWNGILPSYGVEYDTFSFHECCAEDEAPHVAVNANGPAPDGSSEPAPFPLVGDPFHTWVEYDAQSAEFDVYVSQDGILPSAPLISTSVLLDEVLGSELAYAGFTAATGAASSDHDVLSWTVEYGCDTDAIVCGFGVLSPNPKNEFAIHHTSDESEDQTIRFTEIASGQEINGVIRCASVDDDRAFIVYEDAESEPDRKTPGGSIFVEDNGASGDRLTNGRLARPGLNRAIANGCPVPAGSPARQIQSGKIEIPGPPI